MFSDCCKFAEEPFKDIKDVSEIHAESDDEDLFHSVNEVTNLILNH